MGKDQVLRESPLVLPVAKDAVQNPPRLISMVNMQSAGLPIIRCSYATLDELSFPRFGELSAKRQAMSQGNSLQREGLATSFEH